MVVRWKKQARRQQQNILSYYELKAGINVARKIKVKIDRTVDRLSLFPRLGRVLSEFDDDSKVYRSIIANKNYKVIYYIEGEIVYIFAIWDVRQNPQKLQAK